MYTGAVNLIDVWDSNNEQVKVLLTSGFASDGSQRRSLSNAISKAILVGPICCSTITVLSSGYSLFSLLFFLFLFTFLYAEADAKINVKRHDISFLLYACNFY